MNNLTHCRRRTLWRDKIICLFFVCFLFGMLELSIKFIFPQEDELSQICNILEQDSLLFWKLKPKLNTTFRGVKIRTNLLGLRIVGRDIGYKKNKCSRRIVCLGGSSTFGWGLEAKDAYPYKLEELLKQKYELSQDIEVINAGIIGYTSYQGKNFFKNEILKLSPDIIIVPFLVNDVDKYLFYRNNNKCDKDKNEKNEILISFENILNRSRLFRILEKYILQAKGVNTKFYGNIKNPYKENIRVNVEDYKKNLIEIANFAKRKDIKVIFVKMPMRSPFKEKELSDELIDKANKHIICGLNYGESGMYDVAIAEIVKALEYNPYSAKAFYYLGVYSTVRKEFKNADLYFQKAKEMELFECARLTKVYNGIMQEVANQNKVPLVDIVLAFEDFIKGDENKCLFVNPEYDFVHPNAQGHRIISEEIANILIKYRLLPFIHKE